MGGSAPGGAQGPPEPNRGEVVNAEPQTPALEVEDGEAPYARCAEASARGDVSPVPGIESPASGLPALRLLQGTSGPGRRRELTSKFSAPGFQLPAAGGS